MNRSDQGDGSLFGMGQGDGSRGYTGTVFCLKYYDFPFVESFTMLYGAILVGIDRS